MPAAKRFVKICVDNTEQAKRLKKMSAEEEDENVVYVQKSEYDYGFDGPSVKEVPFVRGEIDGLFTWRWSSGNFLETPYVRGVIHGVERERKSANLTIETPYVYGLKHGVKRTTWPDVFIEVPYVHDVAHGVRREVYANGSMLEVPYVRGTIHGVRRETKPTGEVVETVCKSYWREVARGRWRWLVARKRWWWLSEERANVAACVDKWLLKHDLASWIDAKAARRGAWQTLTQTR